MTPSDLIGGAPKPPVRKVSLAVREHLRAGQPPAVLFAVSGGADSLALTLAGAEAADRLNIPYRAVVVDHAMRHESQAEARAVATQLEGLGVSPVRVVRAEAPPGLRALETTARDLRHHLLETEAAAWMRQANLAGVEILFGHTMEDQAETVLLRLSRGASPGALAGIAPRRPATDPAILHGHPLLGLRRADTEAFCTTLGLPWVQDPTNRADGPWRTAGGRPPPRAAVRHDVLPLLREALEQDPVPALARVARLARRDQQALDGWAQDVFTSAWLEGEGALALAPLKPLPTAVRTRVYALAWLRVRPAGLPVLTAAQIEQIDSLTTGKRAPLPGDYTAIRSRTELRFHAP